MAQSMRTIHTIALLSFSLTAFVVGCAAPAEPPSQTEGVKLSDLRPADATRRGMAFPPAVSIKVVTFSIPSAGYERAVRLALAALDSGPGILSSPADFQANGFVAATGSISRMDVISEILRQAQATLLTSNYYTVFDNKGDDIDMTGVTQVTPVPYSNKGKSEILTLKPGRLVIRIIVTRFAARASVFKMTAQPVWKPQQDATFVERVSGRSRDITFRAAGINTNMQAGEMILIGPSPSAHEDTNLADIMMTASDAGWMKLTIIMCTGINQ